MHVSIGDIIFFIILGLIAGAVARLLIPGRQSMGIIATIVLGIIGSFVGGFLFSLLPGGSSPGLHASGIIGSIIGAVVVLLIYIAVRRRSAA